MVNQTLEYVKSCSLKAKNLQHLIEHLVTNGPEGAVSSKCFKSLDLLKKSLQKMEGNNKELSTYPGFNIQLNLEALLTLHIENQHARTHFKLDTCSLYEYALTFGSSLEEAVKRVSKWAAAYYTHTASYYKLPSTSAVTLPKISIPKPAVLQVLTRDEEALMGWWAKKHGKSVRQRNVRQDNTKNRAGTLPFNLYESETISNPLNLLLVTNGVPPEIIESLDNEVREEHTTEQPEPIDTYSESDSDTVSGDENEHAHQTVISVMQPTGLGRTRRLTQRMIDYLQS
mgnify:FL=1